MLCKTDETGTDFLSIFLCLLLNILQCNDLITFLGDILDGSLYLTLCFTRERSWKYLFLCIHLSVMNWFTILTRFAYPLLLHVSASEPGTTLGDVFYMKCLYQLSHCWDYFSPEGGFFCRITGIICLPKKLCCPIAKIICLQKDVFFPFSLTVCVPKEVSCPTAGIIVSRRRFFVLLRLFVSEIRYFIPLLELFVSRRTFSVQFLGLFVSWRIFVFLQELFKPLKRLRNAKHWTWRHWVAYEAIPQ